VDSLKGHLLVATPRLIDPNFARTVLLMLEHTPEGAAGLVLNRPSGRTVADLAEAVFDEPLDWDKPIHVGGPVPGPVLVLHGAEELADQPVLTGLYSTVESVKLLELLRRQVEPSLVLASYAGWGPGQLEREIDENSWRSCPATAAHVLDAGAEELWEAVTRAIGQADVSTLIRGDTRAIDPTQN
jgi:putative transcriptional regulator